jgi:hypothetical protein
MEYYLDSAAPVAVRDKIALDFASILRSSCARIRM